MPLPVSKNQVRRLGSRLRAAAPISDDDLDLLQSVLDAYGEALTAALHRLDSRWGLRPADRLKNTGTIIEKLRRERTTLAGVQDIAGVRIVLGASMGRRDQDRSRDLIIQTFSDGGSPPKVLDRRATPSHGYRAVHVVVHVLDLPVEVQIRTAPQHRWAQFFEKLADEFGRGIRYGEADAVVDGLLSDERLAPRRIELRGRLMAVLRMADAVANVIDRWEREEGTTPFASDRGWAYVEDALTSTEKEARAVLHEITMVLAS